MRRRLSFVGVLLAAGIVSAAAPATRKVGILKVTAPGMVIMLQGGEGKVRGKLQEIPIPPEREVTLPADTYVVSSIKLYAKDTDAKKPVVWTLESSRRLGDLHNITIREGETTTIEGGPPLVAQTSVTYAGLLAKPADQAKGTGRSMTGEVHVFLAYVGRAGEQYLPSAMKGRTPAPAPKVRILDEQGKVLAEGAMGQRHPRYNWRVPVNFKGKFRIEVVADLGPFAWKPDKETWHTIDWHPKDDPAPK